MANRFCLGSVYLEDRPDDDADAMDANIPDEPPLSLGRKVTRSLLLALGAATVALACLYFTANCYRRMRLRNV